MHKQINRKDGKQLHKFICDRDGCLRRAFVLVDPDSPEFVDIKGWGYAGPSDATHVSELDHYCRYCRRD